MSTLAQAQKPGFPVRDILLMLLAYLASRVILVGVTELTILMNPDWPQWDQGNILTAPCRWDCKWYVYAAENGYDPFAKHWERGDGTDWAFFPVLPMLMSGLVWLTALPTNVAGFVVANIAFCGSILLFYFYGSHLFGRKFGLYGGLLMALWPFGIHASVPMSEAVYLPFAIGAVYFARRDKWLLAGLFAAALSATRAVGVFGFVPLFILAIQQHGFLRLVTLRPGTERAAVALALSGFGLGLFMVHLYWRTGDALAFSHIQISWMRQFKWPWMMIIDEMNPAYWDSYAMIRKGSHLITVVVAFVLAAYLARRKLWPEVAFTVATLSMALTAGAAMSLARFTGSLFPMVLAVAMITDRPGWRLPTIVLSAALFGGMVYLWVGLYNYAM